MTLLLVFLGGAVGAPARYVVDRWVQSRRIPLPAGRRTGTRRRMTVSSAELHLPLGTLLVNLIGCLVLGLVVGGVAHHHWSSGTQALLGTGFCGGLTTFSTFSVETVELYQGKLTGRAASYVVLSCALGIGLAAIGYRVLAA